MSAGTDHAPLEEQIGRRAYLRRRRAITGPDLVVVLFPPLFGYV